MTNAIKVLLQMTSVSATCTEFIYYLNKFGEVNYIGKKLRIALERKIVRCSNQFDHQNL
jgi:hypothetical protein